MSAPLPKRRIIRDDGPDPIDVYVGKRLREQRVRRSLSQTMVAKHFGISFQAVQKYEAGHSRIVASTLYRLCELLGVPPAYFFEGYAPEQAGVRLKRKGKP